MIAAYSNTWVDAALTALIDTFFGFPAMVIVLVIIAVLPPGAVSVILALAFVNWALPAAMMRRKAIALLKEEFVVASYALGASRTRTLVRHVLPNAIGPILVLVTQGAAAAIIGESTLSYLGLGLPASVPTWGGMIAKGRDYLLASPHLALFPALALTLTLVAVNRLADACRTSLDPRLTTRLR
jgi:ABC-type dipeptide/oligopeptide/nickel transport system permease subunit